MGKNKDNIISKEEFFALQDRNLPYEGYVDGLGYVLPEVVVIGHQRNPHHRMFSIHKNITYTIACDAIPNTRKQAEMEVKIQREQWEYERKKNGAKNSFKSLINNKLSELTILKFKAATTQDKDYINTVEKAFKIYESLKFSLENNIHIYKVDVPREIHSDKATQDYFKYCNIEDRNPKQQYISQHPDYAVPEPILRERERQKNYKKAVQNWKNADPLASQAVEGMAYGMVAAPFAIGAVELGGVGALATGLRSAFAVSTDMAFLKGGMSWGAQALVNGPSEVNYVAVAGDAFFVVPMTGSIVGGALDVRPFSDKQKYYVAGYNKSMQNTAIDVGSAFVFGKAGAYKWGKLNPILNNSGERYIMFFSTQTWNYVGGYATATKLTDRYGTGSQIEE